MSLYTQLRALCRNHQVGMEVAESMVRSLVSLGIHSAQDFAEQIKTRQQVITEALAVIPQVPQALLDAMPYFCNKGAYFFDDNFVMTPNLRTLYMGMNSNDSNEVHMFVTFIAMGAGVVVSEIGSEQINTGWHDSQVEVLQDGMVKIRVWNLNAVELGKIDFGTKHTVELVYDGTQLYGAMDGVPSKSKVQGTRESPTVNNDLHYVLGAPDDTNMGSGAFFHGFISEFQINARYNAPETTMLHYKIRSSESIKDVSENNHKFQWFGSDKQTKEQPVNLITNDKYRLCMKKLVNNPHMSDLTLTIKGGKKMHAHRAILYARCDFFNKLFASSFADCDTKEMDISHMDENIMLGFLNFAYTGVFDSAIILPADLFQLHIIADQYGMDDLRVECGKRYAESLDEENIGACVLQAHENNCAQLTRACLEYIAQHIVAFVKSDAFERINDPILLKKIMKQFILNQ